LGILNNVCLFFPKFYKIKIFKILPYSNQQFNYEDVISKSSVNTFLLDLVICAKLKFRGKSKNSLKKCTTEHFKNGKILKKFFPNFTKIFPKFAKFAKNFHKNAKFFEKFPKNFKIFQNFVTFKTLF